MSKNGSNFVGASLDRSQSLRFYYGNAARDLEDLLPKEDDSQAHGEIWDSLNQSERLMFQIQESHLRLSFLVNDLRRLIK